MENENLEELIKTSKAGLKDDIDKAMQTMSQNYNKNKNTLATIEQLEEKLKKAEENGKVEIEVNNKNKLIVELKDRRLIFTKIDEKGNVERRDAVLDNEIVLLYDYILHQRDNDLELF